MKTIDFETPPNLEEDGFGGGGGVELQDDRVKKTASGFQNHLELSLGISSNSNTLTTTTTTCMNDWKSGFFGGSPSEGLLLPHHKIDSSSSSSTGWAKKWFSDPGSSFVHPWSLAARQQKAIFEKSHHKSLQVSNLPRAARPPIVGWPPIRSFRKSLQVPKPEMDREKDAKRVKVSAGEASNKAPAEVASPTTMYVKVNMEGYAVGRKINLKDHESYDSLSHALKRMFNNFLSSNYSKNSDEEDEDSEPAPDFHLIYEDFEGDRMLVGDVPWEIFMASVKRLYLAHSPRAKANDGVGKTEEDKN